MRERPILFSTPMVRAIIDGRNPHVLAFACGSWAAALWESNPYVFVVGFKRAERPS